MSKVALLKLEDVTLYAPRSKRALLKNCSFAIETGEFIHLVGENGIGKSLLLECFLGIKKNYRENYSGRIERNFHSYSYLPQLASNNLKIPVNLEAICAQELPFYNQALKEIPYNQASGGEKKRALIGRCLSEPADLYVLDEPFNHLDQLAQSLVGEQLLQLNREGKTLVFTGHLEVNIAISNYRRVELNQWS